MGASAYAEDLCFKWRPRTLAGVAAVQRLWTRECMEVDACEIRRVCRETYAPSVARGPGWRRRWFHRLWNPECIDVDACEIQRVCREALLQGSPANLVGLTAVLEASGIQSV